MTDPTLLEIIARLEGIEAQQREILQLLRHGVTPPEWVDGEALAMSLGIKPRAVEFYRYDLGVIPVDGKVCRKIGRSYEYRIKGCKQLVEEYKAMSPETRRSLKEAWEQSKPR